jgi:hypothetical protein
MPASGSPARRFIWLGKLVFGLGLVLRFVFGPAGREYGIGPLRKLWLAARVIRNNRKLRPMSSTREHLLLIEQILRVPKSTPGDVVECGCFNGGSSANLSLACALTNRRLLVCDSFEGLPTPQHHERYVIRSQDRYYRWSECDYEAEGGLEGVKARIRRFGDIDACRFVKGYFEDTLAHLETDSIVLVFEDADLPSSVYQTLLHLWPKLQEGCRFYSHEPWSVQVVSLFYDVPFWQRHFGTFPPGFYGAANPDTTDAILVGVGYAEKVDAAQIVESGRSVVDAGMRAPAA